MTTFDIDTLQANQTLVSVNDPSFAVLYDSLPLWQLDARQLERAENGTGYFDGLMKVVEEDRLPTRFRFEVNNRRVIYVDGLVLADHSMNGHLIGHALELTNAGSAYYAPVVLRRIKEMSNEH